MLPAVHVVVFVPPTSVSLCAAAPANAATLSAIQSGDTAVAANAIVTAATNTPTAANAAGAAVSQAAASDTAAVAQVAVTAATKDAAAFGTVLASAQAVCFIIWKHWRTGYCHC